MACIPAAQRAGKSKFISWTIFEFHRAVNITGGEELLIIGHCPDQILLSFHSYLVKSNKSWTRQAKRRTSQSNRSLLFTGISTSLVQPCPPTRQSLFLLSQKDCFELYPYFPKGKYRQRRLHMQQAESTICVRKEGLTTSIYYRNKENEKQLENMLTMIRWYIYCE